MSFLADFGSAASARRRSARVAPPTEPLYQEADDDVREDFAAGAYARGGDVDEDGSAGSDVGSDNEEDAGSDGEPASGSAKRSTRPRGPRESFLALVSPNPSARRPAARRTQERHPYVRRYAGTRLLGETPKYAFVYKSGMTDEPQYMGPGMIRGTVATLPLAELRPAVAYMLEHGDPDGRRPTMLARPANFERFEELREPSGGRDILLHEILKEDDDVLADLFLIAGRVGHRGTRARTVGQRASDMLGGAVSASSSLANATDIPYERMRRPADYRPALTRPEYRVINAGSLVPLLANVASPVDDAIVYTPQPARSVKGHLDGNPRVLHGVCDPYMDRWFARTANEAERSGLPELAPYGVLRDDLANIRRNMCPVEATTVNHIVGRLRRGEPVDAADPLDEDTIASLLQSGYTREDVERVWGANANRANPATA